MAMTDQPEQNGNAPGERGYDLRPSQPLGDDTRHTWTRGAGSQQLAQALGWFSIGLGLAEFAAPGSVARLVGVPDTDRNRSTLRMLGLRELTSGLGLLSQQHPAGWAWSRVAGDLMDLSLLGTALTSDDAQKDRVAAATAAVAGVTALDLLCSDQLSRVGTEPQYSQHEPHEGLLRVRAITVNRPPEEVYRFWRDLTNLPRFMHHVQSVQPVGENRLHWTTRGPAGITVEWESEITEDIPNQLIAWRSLPGSMIEASGRVMFQAAPGNRGTEIRVELRYQPPAGALGATIAQIFGKEPKQLLQDSLRTLKQILETGEVVVSAASLGGLQFPQAPARPPAELPQDMMAKAA
jgi:uncharacterized membrane protein